MLIGNDLVDLGTREAEAKARDERFVARIFTETETEWILGASDPDLTLWRFWAAKESAFKIARKLRPAAVFAHRSYEVSVGTPRTPGGPAAGRGTGRAPGRAWGRVDVRGTVVGGTLTISVEWEVSHGHVHCLATSDPDCFQLVRSAVDRIGPEDQEPAAGPLTQRELASVRTAESRATRRLAKRLALEAGLGPVEVFRSPEGRRLGPPRLYEESSEDPLEGWDLTLSHDGRFAAAALMRTEGLELPPPLASPFRSPAPRPRT